MSALGHKQTYAVQNARSALPPIAIAKADIGEPSCLFCPQYSGHVQRTRPCRLWAKRGRPVNVVAKIENRHEAVFTSPDNAGYLFKSEFRRGLVNPLLVREPIPPEE